ncbi:MAG: hypothetical protein PHF14_02890 [Verrucomicrobiota bacterium]|jgi:hypothetical protein|nr:hypothetical protein [Verrucomicrobiota bacterium]
MEHAQRLQQFVIDPVEGLLAVFVRERGGVEHFPKVDGGSNSLPKPCTQLVPVASVGDVDRQDGCATERCQIGGAGDERLLAIGQGVGADADAALRKDQDLLSIPQAPSGLTRSGRIVSAPIDGNGQHQFQEESS